MQNILIVDDDKEIVKAIEIYLERKKYQIFKAFDGIEALEQIKQNDINLIILDIMMPNKDGIETLTQIRKDKNIPVILLSAKSEDIDKIHGLNLGADDYIIKPFRTRELISRANNILRRYNNIQTNIITSSNIKIDLDAQRVYKNDDEIVLTALEYKILALLFTNINQTVSREKILDKIWDIAGNYVNDNTLTVYIKRIRAKLSPNDIIKTIKGIGYRIEN